MRVSTSLSGSRPMTFEGRLELLDVVGHELLLQGHRRGRVFERAVIHRNQLQQVGRHAGAGRGIHWHGISQARQN